MSLEFIEAEIKRFLGNSAPEVLCITGKWGVGKTYAWRKFLVEASKQRSVGLDAYSYVSLFGINSIEDVKYSIFENTVDKKRFEKKPDQESLQERLKDADKTKAFEKLGRTVATLFNRSDIGDMLSRSAFMLVRRQIVCIDDLERSGSELTATEVMGLISLLKEERDCKVVMLLNDEQYADKKDFEKQLEKVADQRIDFELTPLEAVKIAFPDTPECTRHLQDRIVHLGITNIRVITKVKRLAERAIEILEGYEKRTIDRAVATTILAGWAVYEPSIAPSVEELKQYSHITAAMSTHMKSEQSTLLELKDRLNGYPFYGSNPLDEILIDAVETGVWHRHKIRGAAEKMELQTDLNANGFDIVWERFHSGPLVQDEESFLDDLWKAAQREVKTISSEDLNNTVNLLRTCDMDDRADTLIDMFVSSNSDQDAEFFNPSNHHFLPHSVLDQAFEAALLSAYQRHQQQREPSQVLSEVVDMQTWTEADVNIVAKLTVTELVAAFEQMPSGVLKHAVEILREMGKEHHSLKDTTNQALARIAEGSKLRAVQMKALGCSPTTEQISQVEIVTQ